MTCARGKKRPVSVLSSRIKSKQQMLWLDRGCAELAGFVAGKEDYSSRFLCIAFEHLGLIPPKDLSV